MRKFVNIITQIVFVVILFLIFILDYYCSINYLELYVPLLALGFLVLFNSLYLNDVKNYERSKLMYFIIYFAALVGTIFFVNRGIVIDFEYSLSQVQLIPFKLIYNTITSGDLGFAQLLFNYIGNFIMLIPFTVLLIIKDKKYTSYKLMFKILFSITLLIEISEFILGVGAFDIDDFILNISGGMLFLILFKKCISDWYYKTFNKDFYFNKKLSLIITLIMLLLSSVIAGKMLKRIFEVKKYTDNVNYVRGISADRQQEFKFNNYIISIDNLLVIYKDINGQQHEISEGIDENFDIKEVLNHTKFIEEYELYNFYEGSEVKIYECKNINKIIFSNNDFKNEFCSKK